MQDVLADLERWTEAGEEIALATVVKTWGSSPRPQGARFAMTRSGRLAGSVSGGCVESDVFERAMAVLDSAVPELVQYGVSDEMAFEVGLSCGGTIDVFIEPFRPEDAWRAARRALAAQRPCVLATALGPPSLAGRRLALFPEGKPVGGLDPALDAAVAAEAGALLTAGGARLLALPLTAGDAAVFLEALLPPPRLLIVGATHVAMPLCHLARTLGFRVSVIDARSPFATRERFPEADEVLVAWPDEALDRTGLDASSYVVVLTHDAKFDIPTLRRALRSQAPYIGVMGSRATHERRKERLRELGFTEQEMSRIRAPIGLDLGGRSAEEIALAILAQITAVRHGREA